MVKQELCPRCQNEKPDRQMICDNCFNFICNNYKGKISLLTFHYAEIIKIQRDDWYERKKKNWRNERWKV